MNDPKIPTLPIDEDEDEDTTSTVLWLAGQNLAGYLPETSPFLCTSWAEARDVVREDLTRHAESLYERMSDVLRDLVNGHHPKFVRDAVLTEESEDRALLLDIIDAEDALDALDAVENGTDFLVYVGHVARWFHTVPRADAGIAEDLRGDALEDAVLAYNENAY